MKTSLAKAGRTPEFTTVPLRFNYLTYKILIL